MGKEKYEIKLFDNLDDIKEEAKIKEIINNERKLFNEYTNKVDLGFIRCTQIEMSRRVFFPPGSPVRDEATLGVRGNIWCPIF